MTFDEEQEFVAAAKFYVSNNLELNRLSDEDLEEEIENVVNSKLDGQYCTVEQRLSIVKQVYSSIRGLGLLDSIMTDDTITEVMINGKDNIFIEQNGRVKRLDKFFETDRRLEDIIQRIVGMAGREVNQANPIVDTRLQDGSRVNVLLPPIALNKKAIHDDYVEKTTYDDKGNEHKESNKVQNLFPPALRIPHMRPCPRREQLR